MKIIAENKKVFFDYFIEDRYEAGIQLTGTEIKSLRKNPANLRDSHIRIKNNEAFIVNMHISQYDFGNRFNHEPTRSRKLLLHKREIKKLNSAIKEKGYTVVVTKIYFTKSLAKLEIALAKGKKNFDKRAVEKEKSIKRDLEKYTKSA